MFWVFFCIPFSKEGNDCIAKKICRSRKKTATIFYWGHIEDTNFTIKVTFRKVCYALASASLFFIFNLHFNILNYKRQFSNKQY